MNISHREMPGYDQHVAFVESKPYKAWYLICDPGTVGACYLTNQNEIGVHIFKKYRGLNYGRRGVQMLMEGCGDVRYLANISPRNERSIEMFSRLGFKHIQNTYECLPGCS